MANIVALDGRAVGNWRRQPKGRRVELVVEPWLEFHDMVWDAVGTEVGSWSGPWSSPWSWAAQLRSSQEVNLIAGGFGSPHWHAI